MAVMLITKGTSGSAETATGLFRNTIPLPPTRRAPTRRLSRRSAPRECATARSRRGTPIRSASCGETNDLNTSHTLLNEPPDMAVDPLPDPVTGTPGSVYIADGYGNHRIVVYTTADGGKTYTYNRQWGTTCVIDGVRSNSQACPAGTFGATGGGHPHCIVLGNDGNVYACDRPNSRIQVFDRNCGGP